MTVDASGIVLSHNAQAAVLLARVAVGATLGEVAPAWLIEAHLRRVSGALEERSAWADGRIGAHRVKALAVPGVDGAVTWWLVGDSAPASAASAVSAAQELERERVRAGLLQGLSSELLASLDVDRCTALTVRRAARHLADAAVVVGTGDGRSFPVTRCTTDGPVVQERLALDPGQLPGLAEALQGLPAVSSRWIDPREVPSWAVPEGFAGDVARCVTAIADATAPALVGTFVGRVLVSCVDGEWHSLPARLVSEVLRLRGWRVDYLGAQVPTEHLVAHARRTRAQAVLLSSSIPTLLPGAHNAINSCQGAGLPVLAGGAAFGPQGRYARLMQAEWAKDAPDAATLLGRHLRPSGAHAARLPELDLPHLADQEYTMVRRTKLQLVKRTLADVEERFPETRHYSEYQLERTVEDIDFVVSHLATALYVDDPDLFTRFITWTADVLAARGVPPRCLLPALDSLLNQLKDFPRAVGILTAARDLLIPPPPHPD
ncbi:B12-binding domain-containing protein [Streptomyces sp. NPDC087844]|uniref:B12-binding domain-containing protein n=1 Tax=Streptomyces sp. NPDC087844 TaxID=3365805 RepID=UPI0038064346